MATAPTASTVRSPIPVSKPEAEMPLTAIVARLSPMAATFAPVTAGTAP